MLPIGNAGSDFAFDTVSYRVKGRRVRTKRVIAGLRVGNPDILMELLMRLLNTYEWARVNFDDGCNWKRGELAASVRLLSPWNLLNDS